MERIVLGLWSHISAEASMAERGNPYDPTLGALSLASRPGIGGLNIFLGATEDE